MSDSWRRYTLKGVFWWVEGKVEDLVWPVGLEWSGKEAWLVGLGLVENYVWCLDIYVI